jgi:hypothetical protein
MDRSRDSHGEFSGAWLNRREFSSEWEIRRSAENTCAQEARS